jgi:simple sugar transport system ATP-binding protein
MEEPLLSMNGIVVAYGTLLANDHIDLQVHKGEIHALLGENGAGKTTLMKALVGLAPIQRGKIRFNGQDIPVVSPNIAQNAGIGMVHQHFMLIPPLSVAQNVCIGMKSAGYPFPDYKKVTQRIDELSEKYQLKVNPAARVADLSVGEQQRVEIIKSLYRGAKLLILDEPTSVLIPQEIDGLFNIIRNLSAQGTAVIFISHKLNEVMTISRHITVLRQGKVVAKRNTDETDAHELARLMVGKEMEDLPDVKSLSSTAAQVARIEGLHYTDPRGVEKLRGIDLELREGEIHGIAGVDGNGQVELARILAGILPSSAGKVWLGGHEITHFDPARRIQAGMAYIPGDRQQTGLVMDLSITENLILELNNQSPFANRGFLQFKKINSFAEEAIRKYDIRCTDPKQEAGKLSGGNQQKLVLARELYRNPRLIIAVQPTRGLDVGATHFVHSMLLEQRQKGCAILLISTELDEIFSISNRISAIYEGKLMGTFDRAATNRESLGLLMAGKAL